VKIHDVKQGSGEWKTLRLGIPTASEFDAIVTPEFKPRTGQTPETYLYQKLCERLLGFSPDINAFAIDQGAILETEAKPYFQMTFNTEVRTVGFCTSDDGLFGCSPDGLIGDDGGLEIKCPQPHTHLRYLVEGVLPKDYAPQVHGSMFVTGRRWWKFMSYSRQFDPLIIHVDRDELIQAKLRDALMPFRARFDALYNTIKAGRDAQIARENADYQAKITKGDLGELAGEKWLREKEERERAAR
jgi:hypothetical protein